MSVADASFPPLVQAALVEHRKRWPECSEEDALADLFGMGYPCNVTFQAHLARLRRAEDNRHNVFEHPNCFMGWHVASAELWKRGVYRFEITRRSAGRAEKMIGFCKQDVLRVAIELKLCTKPNGFLFA